jgi:hypothetical protein
MNFFLWLNINFQNFGTAGSFIMEIKADIKDNSLILLKQGAEAVSLVTI